METLMLIGLFLLGVYALALVSTLAYDMATGRISRIRGIAHKTSAVSATANSASES